MVLHGKAGPGLLKTYEQERWHIGKFTVDQAYARYINRSAPELRDERVHEEVADFPFELGQRYHESQGVEYGSGGGGKIWEDPAEPTATAGSRAPHFWVDHQQKISIHDLFSITGYTLLVPKSHHNSYWSEAGAVLKEYPITTLVVSNPQFCAAYKVTHSGCVLVRPDGYIAWKAAGVPSDALSRPEVCREKLAGVLRRIMFLDEPTPLAHSELVNGVRDLNMNAEKPTVNGVHEITGDQVLHYLKGLHL
jgi:putative polyketide hydroxylase